MKQETKDILIHIWQSVRMYVLVIFVTAICMANCKGCKHNVITTPKLDYKAEQKDNAIINATMNELHLLKLVNDSLMARKPLVIHHYHTIYDSLVHEDTICRKSLNILYNAFGELNDLNDSIISNSSKRLTEDSILIGALTDKVNQKQSHVTIDSTRVVQLTDTIKTVKRHAFWRGVKLGAIGGAIITEAVNVGAKLVKP